MKFTHEEILIIAFFSCIGKAVVSAAQCILNLTRSKQFLPDSDYCSTDTLLLKSHGIRLPETLNYFSSNRTVQLHAGLPQWYVDGTLALLRKVCCPFVLMPCGRPLPLTVRTSCAELNEFVSIYFAVSAQSFLYGRALGDPFIVHDNTIFFMTNLLNLDSKHYLKLYTPKSLIFSSGDRMLLLLYAPFLVMFVVIDLLTIGKMLTKAHSSTLIIHRAALFTDVLVFTLVIFSVFLLTVPIFGFNSCLVFGGTAATIAAATYFTGKLVEASLVLKNAWLCMFVYDRFVAVWKPLRYKTHTKKNAIVRLVYIGLFSWLLTLALSVWNVGLVNILPECLRLPVMVVCKSLHFVFSEMLLIVEIGLSLAVALRLLHLHRLDKRQHRSGTKIIVTTQLSPCLLLIGSTICNSLLTALHILACVSESLEYAATHNLFNGRVWWHMTVGPTLNRTTMIMNGCVYHTGCCIGFLIHCVFVKSYRDSLLQVLCVRRQQHPHFAATVRQDRMVLQLTATPRTSSFRRAAVSPAPGNVVVQSINCPADTIIRS